MDFKGQKLSERLSQIIMTLFAVVGFVAGYLRQDFDLMIKIFWSGVGLAFVVTALDWPIYNKNPVEWRRPRAAAGGRTGGSGGGRPPKKGSLASLWSLFQ